MECAGIRGFLENAEAKLATNDVEEGEWEEFLLAIDTVYSGEPFRVSDLMDKLSSCRDTDSANVVALRDRMPSEIAEAFNRRDASCSRRLGTSFAARVDRRYGDRRVFITRDAMDKKTKVVRWKVSVS